MDAETAAMVLVGAMCVVSVYGFVRIPADSRWPIRFGGFGHQTTIGRGTGLILWPLLGAAVATLAGAGDGSFAGLTLIGLLLMLGAQLASVVHMARG